MNEQDDYLWDRSGPPDPDVAHLEQLLRPLAHAPLPARRSRRTRWIVGGALAVAAAAAVLLVVTRRSTVRVTDAPAGVGFAYTSDGGQGVLPVGGVLDTGAHRAVLTIADIGRADLGPQTRVRLDHTAKDRHQLFLERGELHAVVNAPPRLFMVATPSTQVIDLGCEYTIAIDEAGAGSIAVQSGKVELEAGAGTLVVAPQGTHARLLAGRKPSVPIANDAPAELVAAIAELERSSFSDDAALGRVLAAARPADSVTVANLYVLVPRARRRDVLDRLSEFVLPPGALTIEQAVTSPESYEPWRQAVVTTHIGEQTPSGGKQKSHE